MGSSVFLQTSVEKHCPEPSTLTLAKGSGKPEDINANFSKQAGHDGPEVPHLSFLGYEV